MKIWSQNAEPVLEKSGISYINCSLAPSHRYVEITGGMDMSGIVWSLYFSHLLVSTFSQNIYFGSYFVCSIQTKIVINSSLFRNIFKP